MPAVKIAVIGVGYLGRFHAQKYAALTEAELVAVVDHSPERSAEMAAEFNTQSVKDYHSLIGQVDAVSIATPTTQHFEIAEFFLKNKVHVLVEKPITATLEEAEKLVQLAAQQQCLLQVGHVQRFTAALMAARKHLRQPSFIESHRLAPFNPRGTDVNVVLDLMIHDIDIILSVMDGEVKRLDASGASVLTPDIDIANARLEFENGAVANVTASRVAVKTERKMRFFQKNSCITVDFQKQVLSRYSKGSKGSKEAYPGIAEIVSEQESFDNDDALMTEIKAFLQAIQNKTPAIVSGHDGKRALDMAMRINSALR